MRINKFVALATGMSRRKADEYILYNRILINSQPAHTGSLVDETDLITLDGTLLRLPEIKTIALHKPVGYVCSRDGQGSKTIYQLLPAELQHLKPVGRLDKDSSGLLLLTNDGDLAQELTHPSKQKSKVYQVALQSPLQPLHHQMITQFGVQLDDGPSSFELQKTDDSAKLWEITMREGRNRQIRRTFAALGYTVTALHRTQFGEYSLNNIAKGTYVQLKT